MTSLRECPRAGCTKRISGDLFACSSHWFSLPPDIRNEIWAAWRNYQRSTIDLAELERAHGRALAFWGQAAP